MSCDHHPGILILGTGNGGGDPVRAVAHAPLDHATPTPPPRRDVVAELRELWAKSAPGTWRCGVVEPTATMRASFSFATWADGPRWTYLDRSPVMHAADARLIAAAINALPALLDVVEAARRLDSVIDAPVDVYLAAAEAQHAALSRLAEIGGAL